jgi:uncharacterized RDD family membrane protein YckC
MGFCAACLSALAEGSTVASPGESPITGSPIGGWRDVVTVSTRPAPGHAFGPYHIERLLGRGGMGDVYEAEHIEQGRRVALKVLNQRLAGRDDRARFLREGQLAASINHPHTVYIFGSEEIDGIPTISMELLPGGTLKDRVTEHGSLPPAAAVDAILQVIAGLDAMHGVGVLHRDVKPSNCFIDRDGTVKVGDFGLSISTLARDVSQLTMTGAFLGTPQFASPEQLKGDPLDVRADIYAVGATLYYLLTGRPPFDDSNVLALVTRMATEAPRSPRALAPSLPRGLAAIVLRCLARDRAQRPASYAVLQDALQPFSSTATTPATLALRFAAGVIDVIILSPLNFLGLAVNALYGFGASTPSTLPSLIAIPMIVAYYAIAEGLWGASVGKRLVGLRVVIAPGGQPPGVLRAVRRTLMFETPAFVTTAITLVVGEVRLLQLMMGSALWRSALSAPFWGMLVVLFSTARRRNGFAAVHDLWSGTRVVHRGVKEIRRPALESAPDLTSSATGSPRRLGPFDVIGALGQTDIGTLLLGFDPRLRRRVWLHQLPVDTPKVSAFTRDLNRPGRLRWLGEQRTSTESWDAYEALDGMPLVTVLDRPQPWRAVRAWLADLAREIGTALNDGSLGRLSLDRVWITRDGRAKLLDFRAPSAPNHSPATTAVPATSAQTFLSEVATSALSGLPRGTTEIGRRPRHALPVSASALLDALDHEQLENWSDVVDRTTALTKGADRVERGRRAATLLPCVIMPLTMAVFVAAMTSMMRYTLGERFAEIEELSMTLSELTMPSTGVFDRAAAEIYIAGRFGPTLSNPQLWTDPLTAGILGPHRQVIERIGAEHPRVSPEEMAAATAALGPFLERQASIRQIRQSLGVWTVGRFMFGVTFLMTALMGIATAWLFRGGLLLRAFGMEVVTNDGEPVSRGRALWRGLLAWGLVIIAPILFVPAFRPAGIPENVAIAVGVVMATLFVAGAAWAVVYPNRGLQDRIAGTYLVPR